MVFWESFKNPTSMLWKKMPQKQIFLLLFLYHFSKLILCCPGPHCNNIQEVENEFSLLFAERDFDQQLLYYCPNGREIEPGNAIMEGRDELYYFFQGAAAFHISEIPATTIETFPLNQLNFIEFGNHSMYQKLLGIQTLTNSGWYAIVWNITNVPGEPTYQGYRDYGSSIAIGYRCGAPQKAPYQPPLSPSPSSFPGWEGEIEKLHLEWSLSMTNFSGLSSAYESLSQRKGGPYLTNDLVGLLRGGNESEFDEFVRGGMEYYSCPLPPEIVENKVVGVGGAEDAFAYAEGGVEIMVGGKEKVFLRDFTYWQREEKGEFSSDGVWKLVIWVRNSNVASFVPE